MRIVVTGAAGFIGSNLIKRLSRDGHDTLAVDDFSSATWSNLVDYPGDVLTADTCRDIDTLRRFGKFDVIFHQASITDTTVTDQKRMMTNNVESFRNILEWAAETGARVVWASSCSIYGQGPVPMRESQKPQPLNVYAFSKLQMERLARLFAPRLKHPIIGLRYSNVYGPGEAHKGRFASMIYQLARQMRAGQRPRVFEHGQQKRDFVYIEDVVQANLKAMQAREGGNFNAGAGASWSFNEVIAELNRVLGTNLEPEYFKNPYDFTQDWTQTDLSEARRVLGYQPQFDLRRGIEAYHESGALGV
ncbi:MAG: NAD-dependent epimerase/dehydratase family protein [Phycisphaerae bacterium]|nr:NAD-dependent epimerase/dehydratase family protein [Phycisphaerae bacterium]MDW8261618.1 NAD-dependent epimerase/dehydratase family protein [Phycisphaerales bacterium]